MKTTGTQRSIYEISSLPDSSHQATLTTETYATFARETLTATINVIFSPVSASGLTRFAEPDGPTIDGYGRDHARVNLSARQANALGLMMSGTYGPPGTGSLRSAILQLSLGSKLQALMAGRGSTLYCLTWRQQATPAGRLISHLRASVRRIADRDCTGWPTPGAKECDKSARDPEAAWRRQSSGSQVNLADATLGLLAWWPSPKASNTTGSGTRGMGGDNLQTVAGWATPAARDYRTPNHTAWKDRGGETKGEQLQNQVAHLIPGASLNGCNAATESYGLLNPVFSLWLQGIPAMWWLCAPPGTRSTRALRKFSSGRISKAEMLKILAYVRDL